MFLLLVTMTLAFAEGYKDFAKEMQYETKYEIALAKAKEQKKNLLVLMVTNYCPWCSKFEKKTLSDKSVDTALKAKYVPLIINKEEKNFPNFLQTPIVPALFFVDHKEEKSYYEHVGFMNKADFLHLIGQLD